MSRLQRDHVVLLRASTRLSTTATLYGQFRACNTALEHADKRGMATEEDLDYMLRHGLVQYKDVVLVGHGQ